MDRVYFGEIKTVFFDRDGVINEVVMRDGKPCSPRRFSEFVLNQDSIRILRYLKKKYNIVIVTNQPDISRNKMKIEDLNMMHSSLEKHSGISNIYYCPSGDRDNCDCRKPRIGMLEKASIDLDFDLKNSLIVGDTWRDLEAGENAGIYTILLDTKYNKHLSPDLRIKSVLDLKKIL